MDATQSFAALYVWNTSATSPTISINTPGVYTIEVIAPCSSLLQEVEVVLSESCNEEAAIFISNVFTPNGDNVNDVFTIYTNPDLILSNTKGTIYDRWGNLVYSSTEIPFSWDGLFNGDIMMSGVYAYIVTVSYRVNGREFEKVFSGDVTLIR
jgi:gliding motility-associated-like protein